MVDRNSPDFDNSLRCILVDGEGKIQVWIRSLYHHDIEDLFPSLDNRTGRVVRLLRTGHLVDNVDDFHPLRKREALVLESNFDCCNRLKIERLKIIT